MIQTEEKSQEKVCFVCGERNGIFESCIQKDSKHDHSSDAHFIHIDCNKKPCPYFDE